MITLLIFLTLFGIAGLALGLFKISTYLTETAQVKPKGFIKGILTFMVCLITAIFQPIDAQRIDAGGVGLKIDRVGNDKGIPVARSVKGWVFYNTWTTDVIEYSIRQRHIDMPTFQVPAKGGTLVPVSPSFNISLRPEKATEVYIHLTKDEDVVGSIAEGWLKTATNIAVTNATNNFSPDSIFNNADNYRVEVEKHLTKQLGKYFIVDQIKPGQQPPPSMVEILQAKANAIQAAQQAELDRRTAVANAETKIAEARGDSSALVIDAMAQAKAIKEKTREISPIYVDFIRATRWNGVQPTTVLGSGSNTLFSIK